MNKNKKKIRKPSGNYFGYIHTLSPSDTRIKIFKQQLKERGFDDTETWSLFIGICSYIIPRLKRYKEINCIIPSVLKTKEEWNEILDKMILAFSLIEEDNWTKQDEYQKEIEEGMELFCKYFRGLWW